MIPASRFIFCCFSFPAIPEIPTHLWIILPPFTPPLDSPTPTHLHLVCLITDLHSASIAISLYCAFLCRENPRKLKIAFPRLPYTAALGVNGASSITSVTQRSADRNGGEALFQLCLFPMGAERCADMNISTFQYTVSSFLGVGSNSFLIPAS